MSGELKRNHQLGWRFLDEKQAMEAVRSGDAYAAIVIPPDFSSDFLSLTTGTFVQPGLEYYVNEKANAIAPKITDVGASTLDDQINSTFVSTVSEAVSQQLKTAGTDAEDRLGIARDDTVGALDDAVAKGANIVLGGESDVEARYVSPTMLLGVNNAMDIFDEEVFGPVLTIHPFASREDAVREIAKGLDR